MGTRRLRSRFLNVIAAFCLLGVCKPLIRMAADAAITASVSDHLLANEKRQQLMESSLEAICKNPIIAAYYGEMNFKVDVWQDRYVKMNLGEVSDNEDTAQSIAYRIIKGSEVVHENLLSRDTGYIDRDPYNRIPQRVLNEEFLKLINDFLEPLDGNQRQEARTQIVNSNVLDPELSKQLIPDIVKEELLAEIAIQQIPDVAVHAITRIRDPKWFRYIADTPCEPVVQKYAIKRYGFFLYHWPKFAIGIGLLFVLAGLVFWRLKRAERGMRRV